MFFWGAALAEGGEGESPLARVLSELFSSSLKTLARFQVLEVCKPKALAHRMTSGGTERATFAQVLWGRCKFVFCGWTGFFLPRPGMKNNLAMSRTDEQNWPFFMGLFCEG